jgi:hypothetical protein
MEQSFLYLGCIIGALVILLLLFLLRGAILNIIGLLVCGGIGVGGYMLLTRVGGIVGTLGIILMIISLILIKQIFTNIKEEGFNDIT